MSLEYDVYLKKHIECVRHACSWIINNLALEDLNSIFPDISTNAIVNLVNLHDHSKVSEEEYNAYDEYFYKGGQDSFEGKRKFDQAWLHHIHNNPHHWQYWVLIHDDGPIDAPNGNKLMALDMPDEYILEMICDWWSFSWAKHLDKMRDLSEYDIDHLYGLDEIFTWYDDHKAKMILSNKTREKVERLLDLIQAKLDSMRLY